jgi:hypothetical protein
MEYELDCGDVDKCVEFAVGIYKSGAQTNRTTGESRGLGKSIDDWAAGKASEIGVRSMLEQNGAKKLELDFAIYAPGQHADKPDIIEVIDGSGSPRRPNVWVEVKSIKYSNRWIGLSMEQMKTIKDGGMNDSDVFLVYTTSESHPTSGRPDILEAFLSRALMPEYNGMAAGFNKGFSIKILAVLTLDDLKKAGAEFKPGEDYVVEADIFKEVKRQPKNVVAEAFSGGPLLGALQGGSDYHGRTGELNVPPGSLKIYSRPNKKSTSYFALALQDVDLSGPVLGWYTLKKDKWYKLQIGRAGRNPSVYNEVLWAAFRNVQQIFGSEDHIKALLEDIMKRI